MVQERLEGGKGNVISKYISEHEAEAGKATVHLVPVINTGEDVIKSTIGSRK